MTDITVNFTTLKPDWANPCKMAIADLNKLFKTKKIGLVLKAGTAAPKGTLVTIKIDAAIGAGMVHGKTQTKTMNGRLIGAQIGLPKDVIISTPSAVRSAGAPLRSVIVAHELVHALGQIKHDSHLMAQTMQKMDGNSPNQDKLKAGAVSMPPLLLSSGSVQLLKKTWP